MLFESTLTPLEVHFLLENFLFISEIEAKDHEKIIEKFLRDAHRVENLKISKIFFRNFWKSQFFGHMDFRI